jgi:hypothetical protein
MKGSPPAPQLSSEIITSLNLFHGVENRYLEGWERFAAAVGPTGGAGQNSAVALRNPLGSNIIAVLEQIFIWTPGASGNFSVQRNVSADLALLVSLTSNRVPDTRQRSSPTLLMSTSTNAASTGVTMLSVSSVTNQLVQVINEENQELPILPGDGVQIQNNTVAQQVNVSWLWRERFLEDSERT